MPPYYRSHYRLSKEGLFDLRALIYKRDNFCCQFCGKLPALSQLPDLHENYRGHKAVWVYDHSAKFHNPSGAWLSLDHIVPLFLGGHPNDPENLRALCAPCNSNRDYEDLCLIPHQSQYANPFAFAEG